MAKKKDNYYLAVRKWQNDSHNGGRYAFHTSNEPTLADAVIDTGMRDVRVPKDPGESVIFLEVANCTRAMYLQKNPTVSPLLWRLSFTHRPIIAGWLAFSHNPTARQVSEDEAKTELAAPPPHDPPHPPGRVQDIMNAVTDVTETVAILETLPRWMQLSAASIREATVRTVFPDESAGMVGIRALIAWAFALLHPRDGARQAAGTLADALTADMAYRYANAHSPKTKTQDPVLHGMPTNPKCRQWVRPSITDVWTRCTKHSHSIDEPHDFGNGGVMMVDAVAQNFPCDRRHWGYCPPFAYPPGRPRL